MRVERVMTDNGSTTKTTCSETPRIAAAFADIYAVRETDRQLIWLKLKRRCDRALTDLGMIEGLIIMGTSSDSSKHENEEHLKREESAQCERDICREEPALTESEMDGVAGGFKFFPVPKVVSKLI